MLGFWCNAINSCIFLRFLMENFTVFEWSLKHFLDLLNSPPYFSRAPWSDWGKSLDFTNVQASVQHFTNHSSWLSSDYTAWFKYLFYHLHISIFSIDIDSSLSKDYIELCRYNFLIFDSRVWLLICISSLSYCSRKAVLYCDWCTMG